MAAEGKETNFWRWQARLAHRLFRLSELKASWTRLKQLYVGCHGGVGSTAAGTLMNKADLLIAIGASFSDLSQIPKKRMVQIEINPLMIARRFPVEVALLGNSAVLIPKLTAKVQQKQNADYVAEITQLKKAWLKQLEKEADVNHEAD